MAINSYDQPDVIEGADGTKAAVTADNDLQVSPQGGMQTSFYPDPMSVPSGDRTEAQYDSDNNLQVRSAVFTDEGSVRLHFTGGPDVSLTGTVTVTNGSAVVTGVGTSFTTELTIGDYIRLAAHASNVATQVASIVSDTEVHLAEGYLGASGSGAAYLNKFVKTLTGSGAVSASAGNRVFSTSGVGSALGCRLIDYLPLTSIFKASVVQAHSTDISKVGFSIDSFSGHSVYMKFTGTSNTVFEFVVRDEDGSETATTVTLKGTELLSAMQKYEIVIHAESVILSINDTIRAQHFFKIPNPYDVLGFCVSVASVNASGAVTFTLSETLIENYDVVNVTNRASHPMYVQVIGGLTVTTDTQGEGFSKGTASLATTTQAPVRKTAYAEQSSGARRSIASASANDSSAGTGARTARVTYYTASGAGPLTEDLTLNGTTGVNTVATDICYIEKIEVLTVGSGLTTAGIITLYAAINKGGAVISTITAGDIATSYAHHYIASGSTSKISSLFCGNSGDAAGKASRFVLKIQPLTANAAEKELSEVIRMPGGVAPVYRGLDTPITAVGPARLTLYVTNESNASYDVFGSFSFTEE